MPAFTTREGKLAEATLPPNATLRTPIFSETSGRKKVCYFVNAADDCTAEPFQVDEDGVPRSLTDGVPIEVLAGKQKRIPTDFPLQQSYLDVKAPEDAAAPIAVTVEVRVED